MFNIGSIVCRKDKGREQFAVCSINNKGEYIIKDGIGEKWGWFKEEDLELFPQQPTNIDLPKFELGEKVILEEGGRQVFVIEEITKQSGVFLYKLENLTNGSRKDGMFPECMFSKLEVFDLCELLKGWEKKEFCSHAYGTVILDEINTIDRTIYTRRKDCRVGREIHYFDGRICKNGRIDLYPSEELMIKYPLEAEKAWEEWECTVGSLEKAVEYNASKFYCDGDGYIDDSAYTIAKQSIIIGLELSQRFSETEIKNIINKNK